MAVLVIALGFEWLSPAASPMSDAIIGRVGRQVKSESKRTGTTRQAEAVTLARPVFSQSRRPAAAKAQAGPPADELPRLSGIMIAGFARHAIFEGSGKPVVGSVGDHLGDYKIVFIAATEVTVDGPHGTEFLSLGFDANRRPVVTPAFAGGDLLAQFRNHRPSHVAVPQPPTLQQMMAHLPRR